MHTIKFEINISVTLTGFVMALSDLTVTNVALLALI